MSAAPGSMYRNLYFCRLLLSFCIVAVFISLLCGVILVNKARQSLSDDRYRDGQNQLLNTRISIEDTYPAVFISAFIGDLLSTVNPTGPNDNFSMFYKEYDQNMYLIYRLVNNLETIVSGNPGTESISIYFNAINLMVDQDAFYKISELSPRNDLIRKLHQGQTPLNRWLPGTVTENSGSLAGNGNLLTYVLTFPFNAEGSRIEGYMFIDIRTEQMRTMLDSMLHGPEERLLMYNREEQLLIGSSNLTEEDMHTVKNKLAYEDTESGVEREDYYSILHESNTKSGWTFASIQPVKSFAPDLRQAYFQISAICLSVLAFGLALSYYLSVISYWPVRQLLVKLQEFNSHLFPNQQRNEFKVFDHVLNGLNDRVMQLSGELNGNKLLALLYGQLTDDELREWLPQEARVIVVNLKLLKAGGGKPSDAQPGHEQGSIDRLVREMFEKHVAPHPCEIVAISAKECSILYFVVESDGAVEGDGSDRSDRAVGAEPGTTDIHEHLRCMIAFGRGKGAAVVAGVGRIATSVEEIRISHEQAARALKYTFLKDFNLTPVLDYEEICGRTGMPDIRYEPYEQGLRAGDPEAVDQFLSDFHEAMKRSDLSLEAIELSLLQMTVTLSKVMIDMNNTDQMFPSSRLFQQLIRDTLDESVASIREQSLRIAVHIQRHLLQNVQYEMVYKLKAYIDDHLDENISLDRLSELASLSSQYVSKQFKEVLQVSFIDYLTNARMERACQLLAGYDLSVNEIAVQAGYNQTKYFCTKFKLKYGVTPMQYRKSFKRTPTEASSDNRVHGYGGASAELQVKTTNDIGEMQRF